MAWEHQLARELRARDNRTESPWHVGEVLSPRRDDSGQLTGELIISAFGGQIMLRKDRLAIKDGVVLESGQVVPLVGNPFLRAGGAQKVLVIAEPPIEIDESLLDWIGR